MPHSNTYVSQQQPPHQSSPHQSSHQQSHQNSVISSPISSPTLFIRFMAIHSFIKTFMETTSELSPLQLSQTSPSPSSSPSLPLIPYTTFIAETNQEPYYCPITLEPFTPHTNITVLPCGHYFERTNIYTWLKTSNTCPCCRMKILK